MKTFALPVYFKFPFIRMTVALLNAIIITMKRLLLILAIFVAVAAIDCSGMVGCTDCSTTAICTVCNSTLNRVLSGTACICDTGYTVSGVL